MINDLSFTFLGGQNVITYRSDKHVDIKRLVKLFEEVSWKDKTDEDRLDAMIENSQIVVTAWDDNKMVGFARCITDFVFNGQINNLVVDARYRGLGIGKKLISDILNSNKKVTYILRGDTENADFYEKLGFELVDYGYVFKRTE